MLVTDYHAKYFAHSLTKRSSSDSVEKLASVLSDAQVDLNPHQIEAALFAFRSPFSRGAILADEVGLGKTIEAGLLLAQKLAERKRRLLVVYPDNFTGAKACCARGAAADVDTSNETGYRQGELEKIDAEEVGLADHALKPHRLHER